MTIFWKYLKRTVVLNQDRAISKLPIYPHSSSLLVHVLIKSTLGFLSQSEYQTDTSWESAQRCCPFNIHELDVNDRHYFRVLIPKHVCLSNSAFRQDPNYLTQYHSVCKLNAIKKKQV